jgi:hypothetical protein
MISIKLLLFIAKIHGLESKSIDFVLAFPQADLNKDIWMDLSIGFEPSKTLIINLSMFSSSKRIYMA